MVPEFLPGDQLLINKRKVSLSQPGAFCLWDGDGYVIKYLEKVYDTDPQRIRVMSRNDRYQPVERLAEEVRIMGRVVWVGRRVG
jgi:phage repressor protein C with HTH and peptisase S24 domain